VPGASLAKARGLTFPRIAPTTGAMSMMVLRRSLALLAPTLEALRGGGMRRPLSAFTTSSTIPSQTAGEFLSDPSLLRELAYVDGKWTAASGTEATYAVEGEGGCLSGRGHSRRRDILPCGF
jgi:hypothetical protein